MSMLCAPTAKSDLPPLPPDHRRSLPGPPPPGVKSLKNFLGPAGYAVWLEDLHHKVGHIVDRVGFGLGHIEETVRQAALVLQCQIVKQAMQTKADATPALCSKCTEPLIDIKQAVPKTIKVYCGFVTFKRTHGFCPQCQTWSFPADFALGLLVNSTASPLVQEMSALLAAKMPTAHAEAIIARVAGITLSRSTLAREAQRQGERGSQMYTRMLSDAQRGVLPKPNTPLPTGGTVIIQIDAFNIRERDHWGKTEAMKNSGQKLERWHWVYVGTVFRLEQRCTTGGKQRAVITEKSVISTRLGIDELMRELHFEAQRRGVATAERVLVLADGAIWIWNAAADRFGSAIQRLDLYHANAYLWAVANELHGSGTAQARKWVKPLLQKVRRDQTPKVIQQLEALKATLSDLKQREVLDKTIGYYSKNQLRMNSYVDADKRNEPKGSGAIESVCRQLQCRVKRCGQFWTPIGDEAILRLDTLWRNGHWGRLFPHSELQQ